MSALLVEEISSERDAQRADFQQEWIQLCGRLERFKVHRVTVLVARVAKGTLSKSCIPNNEKEDFHTCWRGFVSLCGLAGKPHTYSVHARYSEAIVHVAVEFEDS